MKSVLLFFPYPLSVTSKYFLHFSHWILSITIWCNSLQRMSSHFFFFLPVFVLFILVLLLRGHSYGVHIWSQPTGNTPVLIRLVFFFSSQRAYQRLTSLSFPPHTSSLLYTTIAVLPGRAPFSHPPPSPPWLPPFQNMNNSAALPICYCHRDRSSAKIMMFSVEPVGGEQHLRDWRIDFLTSRIVRRPGWRSDVEDWTVLSLGVWSTLGTWLVSSQKRQFLETKMTDFFKVISNCN